MASPRAEVVDAPILRWLGRAEYEPIWRAMQRFVTPEEFEAYRAAALERGFLECVAGPLVRSSYRAEQALARNNAGLGSGGIARR